MANRIFKSADVQRKSDTTIEVKRSFNADRETVFKSFTTPELVRRWMLGPSGWEMPICEMDFREGGQFRWRWKNLTNQSEFGFFGEFRQISSPEMYVNTETFDPGTLGGDMGKTCLITVTFVQEEKFTTVFTKVVYQSKEDLEKALATGMTDGMEISYSLLDKVLCVQPV